jgi:tRNA modification GTPase
MLSDTIVAPATPPGEGGIAIVRLSGASAGACLEAVFKGRVVVGAMTSHRLYHGRLCRPDGRLVDDVLAVIMRNPHSYTGEDVVELHCHGGSQVLRNVLDLMVDTGARLARPGEFTQRAFLNGKLDLAQAEAVIDVIKSRSERACQVALGQLEGRLSQKIHRFADQLTESLAYLEAHIDFPDDEVGILDPDGLLVPVTRVKQEIDELLASFDAGRILRDGVNILILGRPNVGKSSLLNAMLGESRAIVTDLPGTTRDTLEERLVLGGIPVRLIDTAGIRETDDPIEVEGVRRAQEKIAAADLVLLVVDGVVGFLPEDAHAFSGCDVKKTLLVVNKCDLGVLGGAVYPVENDKVLTVSSKRGDGLSQLQNAISTQLLGATSGERSEDVVLTERRHREALVGARGALLRLEGLLGGGLPLECLAVELREALSALGLITGETTPDEILEQIFGRFCVGK